jgi:GNAT superfamily N-acetyltransferase
MTTRRAALPALADNHFAFMDAHRGTIRVTDDALALDGEEAEFSWWAPLSADAAIPGDAGTVRIFPFSGPGWERRLEAAGFKRAGELSYMQAPSGSEAAEPPAGVTVTVVGTDDDARAFALTQAAGFGEPGDTDELTAWWEEFFTRAALRNYGRDDQTLYLLRYGAEPAGEPTGAAGAARAAGAAVALVVHSRGVAGIYAVATRPQYRGRRYAGVLLAAIRAEAHARGERLALQTEVGSTAERLYLNSGFTEVFRSPIYVRG